MDKKEKKLNKKIPKINKINLGWIKKQKNSTKVYLLILVTIISLIMAQFLSVFILNFSRTEKAAADEESYTALTNDDNLSQYYNVIYPYEAGGSRVASSAYLDSSFDLQNIEDGLFQISKEYYPTKSYFYQEGQIIQQGDIEYLLGNDMTEEEYNKLVKSDPEAKNIGINPIAGYTMTLENGDEVKPTKLCSYVYEQDYVTLDSDGHKNVEGLSIALMMEPSITYKKDGQNYTYYYTNEELKQNAEYIIQNLNNYFIGEGLSSETSIVYAIYVPDNEGIETAKNEYIAYTQTQATPTGEERLKWTDIEVTHLVYLSSAAQEYDKELYSNFESFATNINNFTDSYIAVSGEGYGVNGTVKELEISISISSTNSAEIAGFTQYVENLARDSFPGIDVYITIDNPYGTASYISIENGNAQKIVLK